MTTNTMAATIHIQGDSLWLGWAAGTESEMVPFAACNRGETQVLFEWDMLQGCAVLVVLVGLVRFR
jgi:hypothetical protein